jgi:hypothetical protein
MIEKVRDGYAVEQGDLSAENQTKHNGKKPEYCAQSEFACESDRRPEQNNEGSFDGSEPRDGDAEDSEQEELSPADGAQPGYRFCGEDRKG